MKRLIAAMLLCSTMVLTAGCNMAPPQQNQEIEETEISFIQYDEIKDGQEIAVIDTTLGKIKMVLFPKEAPKTIAHFKKLVKEGFYNDKPVYLEGDIKAMVTGADSDDLKKGKVVTEDGKKIPTEKTPNLWHFSGAVSTLSEQKNRFSKEMLADSRFFIIGDIPAKTELITQMQESQYPQTVIDAYKEHGGMPQYTGSFTVFAQVYEGMDIVKTITDQADGSDAHAVKDATIKTITIEQYKK